MSGGRCPIAIAVFAGSFSIAPRWARLRIRLGMVSPMEYLAVRYNVPTQQLMAWSGVLLKLFDVGAKWASIAVILKVFAGVPVIYGIVMSGAGFALLHHSRRTMGRRAYRPCAIRGAVTRGCFSLRGCADAPRRTRYAFDVLGSAATR